MSFVRDLDAPLLQLSPNDFFSLRDACAGVHAFGQIGAGKTSGAKVLAGAYLRAGFGGLVTAVKPEEVELWKRYCREHGRERSLILFDENEGFNFLTYELSRQGMDGIGTVTECLMRILEAAKKTSPTATHHSGEDFWIDAPRKMLRYTILPLYSANGTLSVGDIIRFLSTAPQSPREVTDVGWQKRSGLRSCTTSWWVVSPRRRPATIAEVIRPPPRNTTVFMLVPRKPRRLRARASRHPAWYGQWK